MTLSPYDLLREKRQELGLAEPAVAESAIRQTLFKGLAIGSTLVGLALGVTALLFLRGVMVQAELDRLATVEAEVEQYQSRLDAQKAKLAQVTGANKQLVEGLIAVRSGSALLRDLQLRIPEGIQLTDAQEQGGTTMVLKGLAQEPKAFERINALQLELKRSPLLDTNQGARLVKASRDRTDTQQGKVFVPPVAFELQVAFRKEIPPASEKLILEQLGSEGLSRRFDLLQKEGLLP
ncbi:MULTISPECIES: PilN domain-containing protein [Aphanothece]|uniref:PilN domain-containing protein n=1 Tax=Aphanothece TaxID=1121 RepID=UPI003984D808